MPDQFREESIRASLPETRPTPDTATAAIRKRVAEATQQSPLEAFKSAVEATENTDRTSAELLLKDNIGTEVDSRGKKKLSPEQDTLLESAQKYEKLAGLLIEKGYDHVDFAGFRTEARESIEGILQAWPEMAAIIPADPTQKEQFLAEMLRDPKLMAVVRKRYAEAFSRERKLSDKVTAATIEFDAAKSAEAALAEKTRKAKETIGRLTATLDRFKPGASDDLDLARLTTELRTNKIKMQTAQAEVSALTQKINRLETSIDIRNDNGTETADLESQLDSVRGRRDAAQIAMDAASADIEEQGRLLRLKTTSEEDLEREQANLETLEAQKGETARERAVKHAELEQAKRQRLADERKYVGSLDILPSAFAEYQTAKLQAAEKARIEEAKKAEAEATERGEKAIARQRQIRWDKDRKPTILNSSTSEPNKQAINSDFETLTSRDPGMGPDKVIESMIRAELARDVVAGTMTQAEADTYLAQRMGDEAFLAKVRPDVVSDLLAVTLRSGRKIDSGRATVIVNSEWGKGMIDQAIAKNTELRDALERLKGQGILKGDLLTAMKDNPNMLYILLAMIAGTVAVAVGAPLVAGGIAAATGAKTLR